MQLTASEHTMPQLITHGQEVYLEDGINILCHSFKHC